MCRASRVNAARPGIDPTLIKELIDATKEAADAMCDSLNLDWGVRNTEFEDVKNLAAARNRLSAALDRIKQAASS